MLAHVYNRLQYHATSAPSAQVSASSVDFAGASLLTFMIIRHFNHFVSDSPGLIFNDYSALAGDKVVTSLVSVYVRC